jgi:hypothetical protein
MYDIVNKQQNITLPVAAVVINSVERDNTRVFNKLTGFTLGRSAHGQTSINIGMPVPVNISLSMSFITKFQSDMDQIISNFVPYSNPYIILSWPMPETLAGAAGFSIPQEIRSEVDWSGNIALEYPTDINANTQYHIIGNTSFVIKSWLFPAVQNDTGNIYYIYGNFHNLRNITNFNDLSSVYSNAPPLSSGLYDTTETISISGYPQIMDINFTDYLI